ncbi:hypothetical protein CSA17_00810 [bacterium DOLJORAL78_65_58]|nr:MAG: hypothetical protein CSB20_02165 [bacterium DOLZORAL124_64_63]PIE76711.1 MAG: hypothetical protein CSA17_00810 [bacterium DOLJORAL78_65_58]
MKLKSSYNFIYMPDGEGNTRVLRVPRVAIVGAFLLLLTLTLLAVLYFAGVGMGAGWWPDSSELKTENALLRERVEDLEGEVGAMRVAMDEAFDYQQVLSTAVGVRPLDAETFAAGVGGRSASLIRPGEDIELASAGVGELTRLGDEIKLLVRQARIQKQGYKAMLDTLAARETMRDRIPSIRPLDTGWVSSRFGRRNDPFTGRGRFHHGLDFSVPKGTEVRATADGTVILVQQQRGLGKVVKVDHGDDVVTVYGHLDAFDVQKGDKVRRGQVIARSGNTGRSTAPHLHYEVRLGGRSVNPLPYILDSYAGRN